RALVLRDEERAEPHLVDRSFVAPTAAFLSRAPHVESDLAPGTVALQEHEDHVGANELRGPDVAILGVALLAYAEERESLDHRERPHNDHSGIDSAARGDGARFKSAREGPIPLVEASEDRDGLIEARLEVEGEEA